MNNEISRPTYPDAVVAYYQSAIGLIELGGTVAGLKSLIFVDAPGSVDLSVPPGLQAAVEQLDHPELRGQPVVVGADRVAAARVLLGSRT